ncbi:tyrosine--tRNA ligase [Candidatus Uhrbacteria bacterium RIFCSPHIGHO2_02_FULL_47_44]|uniref:Tyrosine--tRNA ligase n=1 Tax=Candidatus Uhrbacteria bacterium RIFCSPLOWO2_02_FULL_48_18 TaxID=1802408 RepID=A0A1F7V6N3_9BACT|nr:MAG: tyrosine--tRNA ligase [Candidatus Uhrbacteria bacterium RIFCSPHIGHO2_01_FULL_47_10]OGL69758.1 MAG: tyrosine--tRNA ligase [Candidatus Uhrbacteria bacterium RIFCSPHIGHO2_02_FULL_47_44]OGL77860.1 MAG: tyrosine--tRNA ligase [Candidatus Uhrbacteria bacterium RIFCSPHIGHO2_12_FULL_47_12]OGL80312.1 MAG: tyrosine--tRNA ligase [Candidatus Uhrbacteria bacterium RIFCSPLOWO2_01_FULL_47_17]OGL86170.1 MAG: tyrosine--tRNA ligase [Candidatus Uhrbacteria bacterium RIFCSPLOWO2_02_FULL_48_18]OGL93508.1 MA
MTLQELESKLLEHPDLSHLSAEEQFDLLKERAKHIVGEKRLIESLQVCKREGRPLRIKYGVDATGQEIHLGHAVPLFILRRLQNMGHHVVLLIGDFTARVGDPTGRVSTRPVLSDETIKDNARRFADQAGKILDLKRTEVRFNSEWLETMKLADFFRVLSGLTVASAMQRDDFRKRDSVTRAEMLYSTLMALDSVHLKSELELGGDDQLLNFYDAERIMELYNLPPEAAVTTDILLGTSGDGTKMSKSLGNYISVLAEASDMFGKFMSIPDAQMELYFKLLTDLRDTDWELLARGMKDGTFHPRDVKRLLARTVVADLNGKDAAENADQTFKQRVVEKEVPADLPLIQIRKEDAKSWSALLRGLGLPQISSGSEAKRILASKGVHLIVGAEEQVVKEDDALPAANEDVFVRVGKRTYVRFQITQ